MNNYIAHIYHAINLRHWFVAKPFQPQSGEVFAIELQAVIFSKR